jgi:hypothetical protein
MSSNVANGNTHQQIASWRIMLIDADLLELWHSKDFWVIGPAEDRKGFDFILEAKDLFQSLVYAYMNLRESKLI